MNLPPPPSSDPPSRFDIVIDGRPVTVTAGESVLAAARRLGLDIPSLCYHEKCGPLTTCLVCVVKVRTGSSGRVMPSCGLQVQPGMIIDSETDEIHAARRTALELLFSDHVGDCLSPCHRICPLQLNIPVMLRQIESQDWTAAIATVKQALPLPAILGRLCHRPCENGCRRGTHDQPAAIRDLERLVADQDLAAPNPLRPPCKPATGQSVAIVGAGPTGLAAAFFLRREGCAVTVMDRHPEPGGTLRRELAAGVLSPETLGAEVRGLQALGVQFELGVDVGRDVSIDTLLGRFAAVLLALGESGKSQAGHLGLAITPSGLQADPHTAATSRNRVFAAGAAVRPLRQIVRAMSEGRTAALAMHRALSGLPAPRSERPFSSVMGRLSPPELKQFLIGPSPAPRAQPALGLLHGFTLPEARGEAGRCLHCDCRAEGNCKLQHYAALYGVEPSRFRAARRPFEQDRHHGDILFEPGKCILCGICVRLAELAREPLGLTFVGRGFDVRVAAPHHRHIAEGLQRVGRECVAACPTGALSLKDSVRAEPPASAPTCPAT